MGILVCLNGLLIIIASMSNNLIRFLACGGIGIVYSYSLSAIHKILTNKLQVSGFVEYVGWVQTISRLTSLLITINLGWALGFGFSSSMLLMICGILGIFVAIILMLTNPDFINNNKVITF
ncbi:MAG: hypothetical protein BGO77_03210 [Caedibacter sp. 37-49]|nr:MAG: hypothetical protein BGO77_03210 [Caedibacter sp. 37-49]